MSASPTPPKVLVTGASGFIGSRVAEQLVAAGAEVHRIARRPANPDRAGTHVVDLLQRAEVDELLARLRPTHLVHLAWATEHGQFWHDPANLDWSAATMSLLRSFDRAGGTRALFIGSCAEYDWHHPGPYRETDSGAAPATLYGAAKLATAVATTAYGAQTDVDVAWARLFHLYGPGETEARLIPQLLRAAGGGDFELRQPHNVIDLIHVDDAARALVSLLWADATGVFNVASGEPLELERLANVVASVADRDIQTWPPGDVGSARPTRVFADITRLRNETDYSSPRRLEAGLRDLWDRYRSREKETV